MKQFYSFSKVIAVLLLTGGYFQLQGQLTFHSTIQYNYKLDLPETGKTTVSVFARNPNAFTVNLSSYQLSYLYDSIGIQLDTVLENEAILFNQLAANFSQEPLTVGQGTDSCDTQIYIAKAGGSATDIFGPPFTGHAITTNVTRLLARIVFDVQPLGDGCFQGGFASPVNQYTYYVAGVPTTAPMVITSAPTSPLPVKIIKFRASAYNGPSSKLYWEVVEEENVNHYVVERYTEDGAWEIAGKLNAVPDNSRSVKSYELIDKNVFDGKSASKTYFYRLNVIDNDGSQEYSNIENVRFTNNAGGFTVHAFPNPSIDELTVEFNYTENSPEVRELVIFNNLGQIVYSEEVPEGADAVYLNHGTTGLLAGSYMLELRDVDHNSLSKDKIIVQR